MNDSMLMCMRQMYIGSVTVLALMPHSSFLTYASFHMNRTVEEIEVASLLLQMISCRQSRWILHTQI